MKREGVFILLFVLLFSMLALVVAVNDTTNSSTTTSTTTKVPQPNQSRIDKAFTCLETNVKGKCSSLTIQEIALTILASPRNVTSECVDALNAKKKTENCWGDSNCNIKDTSLAILALEHVGATTDEAQNWLLNRTLISTDLIWYLEQDSDEAASCAISYSGQIYNVDVADNKKISSSAGPCLSLAQSSFWLQIASNCYDKEFQVTCNKDFVSTLLYRQENSPTIYVLSDTPTSAASSPITLKIRTKCFGLNSCDYEGSLWATLALYKTGNDVSDFTPYLIALADSNKRYLPDSFIYMITEESTYGTQLIQSQRLGNYWEADQSAYNRFYDSAIAILSLEQSSGNQVPNAKNYLLSDLAQAADGCWRSSNAVAIRDTAIILWALEHRDSTTIISPVSMCTDADYFCIPTSDCPTDKRLPNFFCSGSASCCQENSLKTCSEKQGQQCPSGKVCNSLTVSSSDITACCLGDCVNETTTNECESEAGRLCRSECSSNQEEVTYSCDSSSFVCCKNKTTPSTKTSYWWIWLILILIIILIAVIAFLQREKLKLFWFKLRSKFKKGKPGSAPPQGPGPFPPRPGFPPIRRMPAPIPQRVIRPSPRPTMPSSGSDKKLDETFKRLKEMSK